MGNLTEAKVKAAKAPDSGRVELVDDGCPGLRLRVSASGSKSFIIRKRVNGGKPQVVTLGQYDAARFDLATARKKARTIISDLEAGKAAPKVERANALTVAALVPAYYAAKEGQRRLYEKRRIMEKHILPALGARLAETITRGDVTRFMDTIDPPSMRRATFVVLSSFFKWALPRLERLPGNPCRDAEKPKAAPSRDRVLSSDEFGALYLAAGDLPYPLGPGIRLLMLTGTRRGEVFGASWQEFNLKERTWTIPAHRSKNGLAHVVPLSPSALAVLEALPRFEPPATGPAFLFPLRAAPERHVKTFSKGATKLRAALDARLGRKAEQWVIHDIRRTVATTMQALGISLTVIEAVLNHVSGTRSGVAGTYNRYDYMTERRDALMALEAEILRLAKRAAKKP